MGQKNGYWDTLGHGWGIYAHMNFAEFHKSYVYKALINQKNAHALGRSLVFFKIAASRS